MNPKGHLLVGVAKSVPRMCACAWAAWTGSVMPMAAGLLAAEVPGIAEEPVDGR